MDKSLYKKVCLKLIENKEIVDRKNLNIPKIYNYKRNYRMLYVFMIKLQ